MPNPRCTILLHTTTGNTRLLARLAADRLRRAGHLCTIHDVKHPAPPSLEDTDLLVVACPTMYFRPTLVIERFIERGISLSYAVSDLKPPAAPPAPKPVAAPALAKKPEAKKPEAKKPEAATPAEAKKPAAKEPAAKEPAAKQ